jgi:predicted lipid-binding transport protein (Tim44 family)
MLAGYDAEGKLIEGDARTPHVVTDIWTFARETVSANPNWTLVATASG